MEAKSHIVHALHAGVAGTAGRRYAECVRQIGPDGTVFVVFRQPHKGIGPGIAVRIDLSDVIVAPIAALGEGFPGADVLHLARDYRVSGGKHRLFIVIVDGMAHLDDRAVCGVPVAHAGKTVEGVAPQDFHIGVQCLEKLLAVLLVELDIVHRDQHTPGVVLSRCLLLELHDLIVNGGRSADREFAQIDRQIILRMYGLCLAVWRPIHKFQAFQAKARRVRGVVRTIGDELAERCLPIRGVGTVRRWSRRERTILPCNHTKIVVLQHQRPAAQRALLHGSAVSRQNIPRKGLCLRGQDAH